MRSASPASQPASRRGILHRILPVPLAPPLMRRRYRRGVPPTVDAVRSTRASRARMNVDTGVMAPSARRDRPTGPGARGAGLRRSADRRDRPRRVPAARARGRAHRAHRARHRHRGGVRPHADGARVHRQRPPADVEGPLHPRPRLADQAAHREAVLDAVVASGAAHARVHPGVARDLGVVERADAARSSKASSTATR